MSYFEDFEIHMPKDLNCIPYEELIKNTEEPASTTGRRGLYEHKSYEDVAKEMMRENDEK
jgi:hypothetical protein